MSRLREWAPDIGLGAMVLLIGLVEVAGVDRSNFIEDPRPGLVLVAIAIAVAVGISRHFPAAALILVWSVCGIQLVSGLTLLLVQASIGIVAFSVARWASLATVWASALSIPAAGLLAIARPLYTYSELLPGRGVASLVRRYSSLSDPQYAGYLTLAAAVGVVLLVPWLAGLALRFAARARTSQASQEVAEAARDQAEEIARLRDDQARLARDVHDVVGHSLAVILAQAESAQFLPDDDPEAWRAAMSRTMTNIATSARSSLDDVRSVLAATSGRGGAAPTASLPDLDRLVEGVRAGGHEVIAEEVGTPRPLPPEVEVVATRVLQEMLTNAVKHGERGRAIRIERHWEGDLRIEVENAIGPASGPASGAAGEAGAPGQGLDGMRRRVESVGGRLDLRRRESSSTFTATAWIPTSRTGEFPATRPPDPSAPSAPPAPPARPGDPGLTAPWPVRSR